MECIPGGTRNNFKSYGHKISPMKPEVQHILCDAQTSGGLLCVVRQETVNEFLAITEAAGLDLLAIGETVERGKYLVDVV